MSLHPSLDPDCHVCEAPEVERIIEARPRPIDLLTVTRLLPTREQRNVGPFVFFDHMGPATFLPGGGIDVRPHPHIGLLTLTYLFEGQILHRDSLGTVQLIRPRAINWMTAGKGIVHSERSPDDVRRDGGVLHGIQLWVALPRELEESEPSFTHYPEESLIETRVGNATVRVLVGSAFGQASKAQGPLGMIYLDLLLDSGAELVLPEVEERALYVLEGEINVGTQLGGPRQLLVLSRRQGIRIHSEGGARVLLIGGASLDGPRFMDWNFVSSSKERIELAKRAWRAREFPLVPGDEADFIPLP